MAKFCRILDLGRVPKFPKLPKNQKNTEPVEREIFDQIFHGFCYLQNESQLPQSHPKWVPNSSQIELKSVLPALTENLAQNIMTISNFYSFSKRPICDPYSKYQ